MPHAGTLLSIQGASKRFGSLQALDEVSIDVGVGEIHGLLGENGAGKSTLCNILFGVHRADAGHMGWQVCPISQPARAMRCVQAWPWCTSTSAS